MRNIELLSQAIGILRGKTSTYHLSVKWLINQGCRNCVGGQGSMCHHQWRSAALMYPFFLLIKLDDKRFYWKTFFQYFILYWWFYQFWILMYLGSCNGQQLQSSWGFALDSTWCVYSSLYCSTWFSLREVMNTLYGLCLSKVRDLTMAMLTLTFLLHCWIKCICCIQSTFCKK